MEAQIGSLEEKLSELQKLVQNKESELQELTVSSNQKLSSADKRLEEMAHERNTALKEKTDAVREADKGKVLIDRMKEDEAKYNAQLAATASEVRELRENADKLRNAAIAAETEVKGRDNIITDLAAREKDAISRLEHLAHELQAEKEKTVKLSVELEAMKQRVSVYEAAEQKLLPKKKRSKSSSPTGQAGPPLFNEVEGPPAT